MRFIYSLFVVIGTDIRFIRNIFLLNFIYFVFVCPQTVHSQWYRSLYQIAQEDHEMSGFKSIAEMNELAKQYLNYNELTAFVPTNEAFRKYHGEILKDLALYHITFEIKAIETLNTTTNSLTPVIEEFPPLWITRIAGEIYVNNAKIIHQQWNYLLRIHYDELGKQQVYHRIDDILNPMIISPKFNPNANDFLSSSFKWNLPGGISVSKFFVKIQENKLQHVFKDNAGHTFFIPIDSGIDSSNFQQLNHHVVAGHIIPFYILFTRPTQKNFAYETMANDASLYMVISFVEIDGKLYVKGRKNGPGNQHEEYFTEIIVENIPVKNGVIHLISKPLISSSNKSLGLFPYKSVIKKISNDPELEIFYAMGEQTNFNKIFNVEGTQFTYFVPRDTSWRQADRQGLKATEDNLTILKRHLIVSQSAYSIEQLESLTKANNNSYLELSSEGGPLKIMVLKIDEDYYIKWFNKYIQVLRSNYECTNGIVHILAGPMVDFRREQISESNYYENYWNAFKNVLKKSAKIL